MPYAIDLFCGAGGFSEGILQAGFDIIFSSDKSPMAEETYTNRHQQLGLIEGVDTHFELADIKELTSDKIFQSINSLKYGNIFEKGTVDVIFGGPPCQGFSRLGKRDSKDPRNMLFHEYLRIIKDVMPRYVVMENVTGILDMQMLDFPSVLDNRIYEGQNLVQSILRNELEELGYTLLDVQVLNAANFGVPQQRNRVVFLAYRNDVTPIEYPESDNDIPCVTVYDALGDLYDGGFNYETDYSLQSQLGRTPNVNGHPIVNVNPSNMETSKHDDIVMQRFSLYQQGENRAKAVNRIQLEGLELQRDYPNLFIESLFQLNGKANQPHILKQLKKQDLFQESFKSERWLQFTNRQLGLLSMNDNDNSVVRQHILKSLALRLKTSFEDAELFWNEVKSHLNSEITGDKFSKMLRDGDLTPAAIEAIFTKKSIRVRLSQVTVSPTMVTLPDDYIHPFFNRVLTVREMARLQSFDDSFEFLGKRTTGGDKRAKETPQFTQVGNAVPPLLAKVIAEQVMTAINQQQ
ncbi:DNA cytosine methyltransferase [Streptococcus sp. X16XC17]|uniref:DNA cytosine methyltransferase n=1 Tax=unclassified Streptococcus TaxID=2608887 RepID=UPI00066FCE24|nr:MULTISPECIES: DNA cytosine methyltransferase [unclassified Streptococcus]TCD45747.1 DNA cytosine methyltransferase [Streptococcus sp. X16XC17]